MKSESAQRDWYGDWFSSDRMAKRRHFILPCVDYRYGVPERKVCVVSNLQALMAMCQQVPPWLKALEAQAEGLELLSRHVTGAAELGSETTVTDCASEFSRALATLATTLRGHCEQVRRAGAFLAAELPTAERARLDAES